MLEITVRLDDETLYMLGRISQATGRPIAEVLETAAKAYVTQVGPAAIAATTTDDDYSDYSEE